MAASKYSLKLEVLTRVYIVLALLVFVGVAIFFRSFKIAVVDQDKWKSKEDSLYVKLLDAPSDRGDILAADGSLLSTSQQFFDIYFDVTTPSQQLFDASVDSLALLLSTHVESQYSQMAYRNWLIQNRLARNRYMKIKVNARLDQLDLIRAFPIFREGQHAGGLIVQRHNKRHMPFGSMAKRTIGVKVADSNNWTGLEEAYDDQLRGRNTKMLMTRTPGNVWVPLEDFVDVEPLRGKDLLTTLDVNIQDITHQSLKRAIVNHQAEWGCAVVMDVKTGAIVAMSNLARKDTLVFEDINHAVRDAIEPGSTFKTATLLALLDDELVQLDDSINIEKGYLKIHDVELHDSEPHGLEWTNIRTAFAMSSNVGMAKLAMQHYGSAERQNRFYNKLRTFGLDDICKIDLDGEGQPVLYEPKRWSGTTLPWMSFGYEVALTPMQLLTFYNGIANNGRVMKPQLVRELQNNGQTEKFFRPEVLNSHLASRPAIDRVKALLTEVVGSGTGRSLYTDVYNIAGKTGTTQLNYERINKDVKIGGYRASFVGYFPADNPVYSCIVVINRPSQGGFYGAGVAGPVFRKIADHIMATKPEVGQLINVGNKPLLAPAAMPKMSGGWMEDFRTIFKVLGVRAVPTSKSTWASALPDTNRVVLRERLVKADHVPNVQGMGLRDALFLLENANLKVKISGHGKVVRQSLAPGTKGRGQIISIVLQ